MKETRYKANPCQPYSLHDMRINRIVIRKDSVEFMFEDGFEEIPAPGEWDEEKDYRVDGSLLVEGPDYDFCAVYVQSISGRYGGFRGEKLELGDFVRKYREFSFEIVEEYYGYHRLQYEGYLSLPDVWPPREMTLSLGYFTGDIVYRVNEKPEEASDAE